MFRDEDGAWSMYDFMQTWAGVRRITTSHVETLSGSTPCAIYINIPLYVNMHVNIYLHMYVNIHIDIYVYVYIDVYIYILYTYIYICVCVCVCKYTNEYM